MILRGVVATLALAWAAHAAEPGIAFSGLLTADGKTRIAVTNKATDSTEWVEAGAEFAGYKITRYDEKEEAIFVKKDGAEYRIPLAAAKAPTDTRRAAPTGLMAASPANDPSAAAIRGNLRTLAAAARQFQQEHGGAQVSYADLVGPGKFIGEVKSIAGENYTTLSFAPNVTAVSVTTATGATVSLELPPANPSAPSAPLPQAIPNTHGALAAAPRTASLPAPIASTAATTTASSQVPVAPPTESVTPTGREPASPSYTIQGGDTWEKISASTGVPVEQLKRINPVVNGSSLPAGQTIRIR